MAYTNRITTDGKPLQVADIHRRQRAYLEAVEPIARERVRLRLLFANVTIMIPGGEIREMLPPEIKAIDDKYAELTKALQLHFLKTANAGSEARNSRIYANTEKKINEQNITCKFPRTVF